MLFLGPIFIYLFIWMLFRRNRLLSLYNNFRSLLGALFIYFIYSFIWIQYRKLFCSLCMKIPDHFRGIICLFIYWRKSRLLFSYHNFRSFLEGHTYLYIYIYIYLFLLILFRNNRVLCWCGNFRLFSRAYIYLFIYMNTIQE
jgi:hypothetical protein